MIICPDLGLTFIHIPKTGGKAVAAALRATTRTIIDESHAILDGPPEHPAFAFVRNPYTRFASFWFGFFTIVRMKPMNELYVRAALDHPLMRPQTAWLPHVEHVGRYETLQADLSRFVGRDVELPVIGKSQQGPLTQVAIDLVGEAYAEEAAMFGYGVIT